MINCSYEVTSGLDKYICIIKRTLWTPPYEYAPLSNWIEIQNKLDFV